MIEVRRSLCRQLATIYRRTFRRPYFPRPPVVEFRADTDGLCIRAATEEAAVEYRQAGDYRPANLSLPLDALSTVQGRDDTIVVLQPGSAGQTVARWQDAGVPQVMAFAQTNDDKAPKFPELPAHFQSNSSALLTALDAAMASTARDSVRYALNRVQLKGKTGQVVGTDSKQLFVEGGFDFGWTDDVLIPRISAFGCPELGAPDFVEIGKTDHHVVVRAGSWTFFLTIDTTGRYPDFESIIPKSHTSACRFGAEDVEFLLRSLPRLPGNADENKPTTLDLNGTVAVRAKAADQQQVNELKLSRSEYSGNPVQVNLNRDHFCRALQLGFTEMRIIDSNRPLVCRTERRTYLTMPLAKEGIVPPSADVLLIDSKSAAGPMKTFQTKPERSTMTTPSTNGHSVSETPPRRRTTNGPAGRNRIALDALLAEAQQLKKAIADLHGRSSRLLIALKRYGKHSRQVAATLKSLKQLQTIDA